MLDRRSELDAFKRDISLVEYALASGYTADRKASSQNSVVLQDARGDKVVAAKAQDGHWIFFSVRDDQDNGTIIDFVQRRTGASLGEVRKELRPWLGRAPSPAPLAGSASHHRDLMPASKDLVRVRARLEGMSVAATHSYLEGERAIPGTLLQHARFAGRVRIDERGNAIFPHQNENGFCGWEAKNRGFTGFAPGGKKGLWTSAAFDGDNTLVVAESAIDALSFAALWPSQCARYASIAGAMNSGQPKLLRLAAGALPRSSRVLIATDNDEGGDRLTEAVRSALKDLPLQVLEDRPRERGCDWNDVLRASR